MGPHQQHHSTWRRFFPRPSFALFPPISVCIFIFVDNLSNKPLFFTHSSAPLDCSINFTLVVPFLQLCPLAWTILVEPPFWLLLRALKDTRLGPRLEETRRRCRMAPQDPSKLRLVVKGRPRCKRNSQDKPQADEELEQQRPPTQAKSWSQIAQGSNDPTQNKQASHGRSGSDYVNWVSNARTRRYRPHIPASRIAHARICFTPYMHTVTSLFKIALHSKWY